MALKPKRFRVEGTPTKFPPEYPPAPPKPPKPEPIRYAFQRRGTDAVFAHGCEVVLIDVEQKVATNVGEVTAKPGDWLVAVPHFSSVRELLLYHDADFRALFYPVGRDAAAILASREGR